MQLSSQTLSLSEKLNLLADAAKYDVACTSSGVNRAGKQGHLGNSVSCGICPVSYTHLLGELTLQPVITGSGGLALANHLGIPFTQEVIAVSTSLKALAPQTDVAIELGGEDAKIIYFEGGNVEQRMNGICAGGTGSFIDQMASLPVSYTHLDVYKRQG